MSITKSRKSRHRKISGSGTAPKCRPKTTDTKNKHPRDTRRLRLDARHEDAVDPILAAEIDDFFGEDEIVGVEEYTHLESVLPHKRQGKSSKPKTTPSTDVSFAPPTVSLRVPLPALSVAATETVKPSSALRKKVTRRRQIDPTTCERNYSSDEVEFMTALDEYKRKSGRMFPTCSEILEVLKGLGYSKTVPLTRSMEENDEADTIPTDVVDSELPQSTIPFVPPLVVAVHG